MTRTTLKNILEGMGSVLEIYPASRPSTIELSQRTSFKEKTVEEALRGDMEKIGGDFRRVISRIPECTNARNR